MLIAYFTEYATALSPPTMILKKSLLVVDKKSALDMVAYVVLLALQFLSHND